MCYSKQNSFVRLKKISWFLCVCVCVLRVVCLCRWQPRDQGLPAHPEHHTGGPATRGGPWQKKQLQERRGEPAGDPGVCLLRFPSFPSTISCHILCVPWFKRWSHDCPGRESWILCTCSGTEDLYNWHKSHDFFFPPLAVCEIWYIALF